MTQEQKRQVAESLRGFCEKMGSQNKAATAIGVSAATISKVLSGKWDTIDDKMWRQVGAACGHDDGNWQIVETRAYRRMVFLLENAREDAQVFAVTGYAGSGKTEAIKNYSANHQNVFHLSCSEFWSKSTFIQKLLKALGRTMGGTMNEQMEDAISTLKQTERPLLILDEADKLSNSVLYFFITLYNALEDHCGIVMCATSHLQKKIEKGVRLNKKGYEEIYSRIGRNFISVPVINDQDIADVCRANGVTDKADIKTVTADADSDLRRVKRKIWAMKKGNRRQEA